MDYTLVLLLLLLRKPTKKASQCLIQYLQLNKQGDVNGRQELIKEIEIILKLELVKIQTMNDLHRVISDTLREHKQQQKVQNGNVIDLFVRNISLMFNQLDFSQLIRLWEDFRQKDSTGYVNDPFFIDSQIDAILIKIEDYSTSQKSDQLSTQVESIQSSGNLKLQYIKAQLSAGLRYPFKAIKYARKFYDLSLQLLVPKRVNHAILNAIQLNLTMNFYDEALNGLSEALRLSQANSDEVSINQCLINLYEIAFKHGYIKQAIILLEYAVNHALQLSPIHKLQNCLLYGAITKFESIHCSLLEKKNIKWTDLVHQSVKALIQSYEENIDQLLTVNHIISSVNYGNITLVKIALLQAKFSVQTDNIVQLQFEAIKAIMLSNPLVYLNELMDLEQKHPNLNNQMLLYILTISISLFALSQDSNSIQVLKLRAQELLEITPDPYISQLIGQLPIKHPKIRVNKMLQQDGTELEIITLCKQYSLKQEYVQMKLKSIMQLIETGQNERAEEKLRKLTSNGISQLDQQIVAQYWNIMGKLKQNAMFYQYSINAAVSVGDLEQIRSGYYHLALIFDHEGNYILREVAAEQFNKCELLLEACQQNNSIRLYNIPSNKLLEYHLRFLKIIGQQLKCNLVQNI